jgi:hypothetical protein
MVWNENEGQLMHLDGYRTFAPDLTVFSAELRAAEVLIPIMIVKFVHTMLIERKVHISS